MPDLQALFSELIRFETELWNAIDARLQADYGLPLTWFDPMQVISRRESCRVYDIAAELSITVGGTSKLVDRIEASGYCRRRPNPGDRRSSIIELTAAGGRLLAEATRAFEDELQARIGSAIPARSLQQFSTALTKLRYANNHAEAAGRPTPLIAPQQRAGLPSGPTSGHGKGWLQPASESAQRARR